MISQYFTFGQSHSHPHTGEKMKDYVVEIEAPTKAIARQTMVDLYDLKWAFQYDKMPEDHPQGFYEFKIYETITVHSDGTVLRQGYEGGLKPENHD